MQEASAHSHAHIDEPARTLGPVSATCIVIGAIIGVGIFFTPSRVADLAQSGSMALIAWSVGGAIALCGALTFAELGGLYPNNGGQYEILRDSYGPFPAFLFVFCNATAIQAGAIGIIAIVCTKNIGVAVADAVPTGWWLIAISLVMIVGLVFANCVGVKWGSGIQNVTTFAKVATLIAITGLALFVPTAPATQPASSPSIDGQHLSVVAAICAALVPAFFTFGGWQHALWIAGEVRQPRRNVPLSIVGGVLIVITVYLLVNWAYLHLLGYASVVASKTLAADATAAAWPGMGRRVIAGAVGFSAFGVLNAQLLSGPRLVYGMAHDGRFFKLFAKLSDKFGTPIPAILLLGVTAIVLLFLAGEDGIDKLLNGVVMIDGVFFALTGVALIVLRKKRPAADRPVRVLGYPVIPVLFVVGECSMVAGSFFDESVRTAALFGVAWIAAAALCYAIFFRKQAAKPQ